MLSWIICQHIRFKAFELLIESAVAKVIYLSPYSPDFNPIENCWSKLKQYLRSYTARSRDVLEEAVTLGLDLITSSDIRNWFAHCCYCTS
jgi:transposase